MERTKSFIRSCKTRFVEPAMFSLVNSPNTPDFYNEQILAFGASYKSIEYDWKAFMVVFEHILRNIDFVSAKLELETEINGHFQFFWMKKDAHTSFSPEDHMLETKNWFFGYGFRDMWGLLEKDFEERDVFSEGLYPLKFYRPVVERLNDFFDKNGLVGEKLYLLKHLGDFASGDQLLPILEFLQLNGLLEYGLEGGKGYWVKALREPIEIPFSPK